MTGLRRSLRRRRRPVGVIAAFAGMLPLLAIAPADAQTADADLAVTLDAPAQVASGTNATFVMRITNGSDAAAVKTRAAQAVPAGTTFVRATPSRGTCADPDAKGVVICQIGRVAKGGTASVTLVVRAATPGGSILGQARVRSDTSDPNPANNSTTTPVRVTRQAADLSIDVTPSKSTAAPGEDVTYQLDVVNNGPTAAAKVQVVDTLPRGATFQTLIPASGASTAPGTSPGFKCQTPPAGESGRIVCTMNQLRANARASVVFASRVARDNGVLTNIAFVQSSAADRDLANNTKTTEVLAGTTVRETLAESDLGIYVARTAYRVSQGEELTYVASVGNGGPDVAPNVVVTLPVPAGMGFLSVDVAPQGLSCAAPAVGASGVVRCQLGDVPAAEWIVISTTVRATAAWNSVINGTAVVTQGDRTVDRSPNDNVVLWQTPVIEDPQSATTNKEHALNELMDTKEAMSNAPRDAARIGVVKLRSFEHNLVEYAVGVSNDWYPAGWSVPVVIQSAQGTPMAMVSALNGASCGAIVPSVDGTHRLSCTSGPLGRGWTEIVKVVVAVDERALANAPLYTKLPTCRRSEPFSKHDAHHHDAWLGECVESGSAAAVIATIPFAADDAIDANNTAAVCVRSKITKESGLYQGQEDYDVTVVHGTFALAGVQWGLAQVAEAEVYKRLGTPPHDLVHLQLCPSRMVRQPGHTMTVWDTRLLPPA